MNEIAKYLLAGEIGFEYAAADEINRLEAEIERLTEANAALMAERASLIDTKRDQIERLTAERDAALAKLAQYKGAEVVAWVSPTRAALLFSAGKENEDLWLRVSSLKRHNYTPLIRKPEVSP
jgi:predicted transcriptional regulator